jgi:hypothetical protein
VSRRQVLQGLGATAAAGAVGRARLASAQAKVTLTYVNYSAGLDKPMWDSLIGEFSKANPNIAQESGMTPLLLGRGQGRSGSPARNAEPARPQPGGAGSR